MFLIPEILWGVMFGLPSLAGSSFRESADNHFALVVITLIQFVGVLFSSVLVFKKGTGKYKNSIGIILTGISIWALVIFYALYATLHMWS